MFGKKEITLRELIVGSVLGILFYFIIAVLNISNEDSYDWKVKTIFNEGGIFNISAYLLFCLWSILIVSWILHLCVRIGRMFLDKILRSRK